MERYAGEQGAGEMCDDGVVERRSPGPISARLTLVLALACVAGCSGSGGSANLPDEAARIEAARAVVSEFFGHVDARDCAALAPMFLDGATAEQCRRFLEEVEHRQLGLAGIEDAYIDGRDPRAVVVRARMSSRKGEERKLVRVQLVGSAWKIRL